MPHNWITSFRSMSVGSGIHFFCQDDSLNFTMNVPNTKWKCRMYNDYCSHVGYIKTPSHIPNRNGLK